VLEQTVTELGWYPDPMQRHAQRFHDGRRWTVHVADGDTLTIDLAPHDVLVEPVVQPVAQAAPPEPVVPESSAAPAPRISPAVVRVGVPGREIVMQLAMVALLVAFLVISIVR
jgi:hypothetical protein